MSRVAFLRKASGWSRLDLAIRAGVTESTIIRAERSRVSLIGERVREICEGFRDERGDQ